MKKLVLIDGHAILHRAYHAFPTTLRTRKGEMVNAVYGFTRMLLQVIGDLKPDYLAVAFDLPVPTFRHSEYLGYQAKRPQVDKELKDQIARVKEVVTALNIPALSQAGFEADDLIGTLAWQANQKKNLQTLIVTGDRDLFQLVDKKTRVYLPKKGFAEPEVYDVPKVKRDLEISPEQVVDYKALVGDASDNYPGVPGIGPKTAVKLLQQFSDLDTIYNRLAEVEEKTRRKLEEGKELAYLSQKLARIVTDASVKLDLRACRVHDYDQQKAIALFQELEFRSLISKLPGVEVERKPENEQTKLFSNPKSQLDIGA